MSERTGEQVSTGLRLTLDRDRCAGHGRCYSLEPELFDSDDTGYPLVLHDVVPAGLEPNARNAVGNCPEGSISLVKA